MHSQLFLFLKNFVSKKVRFLTRNIHSRKIRMGVLKDFNTSVVKREDTVESSDKHNIIESGISYSGICKNRSCGAYNLSVVHNRGYGSHLVNDDIMNHVPSCPLCHQEIIVDVINVFRCKAVLTVHDREEKSTEFVASGKEVVKIGARGDDAAIASTTRLVTITAQKPASESCLLM